MRSNQLGKSWRRGPFFLKPPMTRYGPSGRQRPAHDHETEANATARDDSQPDMSAQLGEQQRPHDPADATGISLMRLGEAFGPPTSEIGICTKQDQPRDRGHGDIDARRTGLD